MNNFDSDPEDFAKTFCDDLGIQDPEVGVSKATTLFSTSPLSHSSKCWFLKTNITLFFAACSCLCY